MKHFLLMLIFLAGITGVYGQPGAGQAVIEVTKVNGDSIAVNVQVLDAPSEDSAWRSHVANQIKNVIVTDIDKDAKKGKYTLVVYYIVSKDGSLSDIGCDSDPGYGICNAAMRVLKKSKNWRPR